MRNLNSMEFMDRLQSQQTKRHQRMLKKTSGVLSGSFASDKSDSFTSDSFASRSPLPRGRSPRSLEKRRSSVGPRSQEIQDSIPKIAWHLFSAKKRLQSLEYYFRAGLLLSKEGRGAAVDMFRKCDTIAEELGDEVSDYMRARYKFRLCTSFCDRGFFHQCLDVGVQALHLLGDKDDKSPSTFRVGASMAALWLNNALRGCWCGRRRQPASEVPEDFVSLERSKRQP